MTPNRKNALNWPAFLLWCFFNVLLPLFPIVLRLFISEIAINHTDIIENMELLYYTLIICILHFNVYTESESKNIQVRAQRLHTMIVCILGMFDVAIIITIYSKNAIDNIRFWCILFAVLAAISLFTAKLIVELNKNRGAMA